MTDMGKSSYINTLTAPIDVDIRILSTSSDGSKFIGSIKTKPSGPQKFPVGPTPDDVKRINSSIQALIEQISANIGLDHAYHGEYTEIANKGRFAFISTFYHTELRKIIREILGSRATIEISSDNYLIPWEWLYDEPAGSKADPKLFWGMRHILSRNLILDDNEGDYSNLKPPRLQFPPEVGLIYYKDKDLKYIVENELEMLHNLAEQQQIILIPLGELDSDKHDEELARIRQFFNRENLQVIHFACHAPREAYDEPFLLVSNHFAVTLEELEGLEFRIKSHALLILNACLTGTVNPLSIMSNWAIFFSRKGAKGIVATEFEVPDWFAAEFITEVYKYLLQGKTIGQAILVARQHFLKLGNPLGLAYSLYAPPSLYIVEPQDITPSLLTVTEPSTMQDAPST